jgi:hypothetical protein
MTVHSGVACLVVSLGLSLACEQGSKIEAETRDLTEAQNNTGNVARDLEARLQKAKAEVVDLEKKLAMARAGVTEDVMKERSELDQALKSQRGEVQEKVNEARQEAQVLNKDTDRAMQQLQKTAPPQVDTTLKTETNVVTGAQQQVESPARNELIPVRGGPEQQPSNAPPDVQSTTSTTTSAPPQAPAPSDAPQP